jgi:hypothetical protein
VILKPERRLLELDRVWRQRHSMRRGRRGLLLF